MAKIAVHGFINTDMIGRVDAFTEIDQETEMNSLLISPGGSAANVAVGLSRLGDEVYFLGAVGQHTYTSFLLDSLEAVRRDYIQTVPNTASGMVMVLVDNDGLRTMYTYAGANLLYDVSQVPQHFCRELDLLHLSSPRLLLADQLVKWKMDNPRLRVSFDPSSLLTKKGLSSLEPLFSRTDILFLNRSELSDLFGAMEIDQALQVLHEIGVKEIFIKLGSDGAVYSSVSDDDRDVLFLPAMNVKAVDSTGSGDAFAVGVLYGISRGWTKERILQAGITLGARVVSHIGARNGLPYANEWGG